MRRVTWSDVITLSRAWTSDVMVLKWQWNLITKGSMFIRTKFHINRLTHTYFTAFLYVLSDHPSYLESKEKKMKNKKLNAFSTSTDPTQLKHGYVYFMPKCIQILIHEDHGWSAWWSARTDWLTRNEWMNESAKLEGPIFLSFLPA